MPDLMTVEQFVAERDELADGGRWTELVAGKINPKGWCLLFALKPK